MNATSPRCADESAHSGTCLSFRLVTEQLPSKASEPAISRSQRYILQIITQHILHPHTLLLYASTMKRTSEPYPFTTSARHSKGFSPVLLNHCSVKSSSRLPPKGQYMSVPPACKIKVHIYFNKIKI